MNILVVGYGEVGSAHAKVLAEGGHAVQATDLDMSRVPAEFKPTKKWPVDVMLFAMRYSDQFVEDCRTYLEGREPKHVCILSTVPVGTTKAVRKDACHSTTRGMHPRLDESIKVIPKHVGGPDAVWMADVFRKAGVPIGGVHRRAETTELAHILNNSSYAVNCVLADELAKVCRHYGLDYSEVVMAYTKTNNEGFLAIDHPSKMRYVLTPPGGRLGGHCIQQSAALIPKEVRGVLLDRAATYND
jgi:UDP-glucose 6-dehydrogenase